MRSSSFAVALIATLALTACGGGGGSSTPTSPAPIARGNVTVSSFQATGTRTSSGGFEVEVVARLRETGGVNTTINSVVVVNAYAEPDRAAGAAQNRMARYGVVELRNECRRQGLKLADLPEDNEAFNGVVAAVPVLSESVMAIADALHQGWVTSLRRIALRCERTKRSKAQVVALAERQLLNGLKSATRDVLHEAFGATRQAYMRSLARAAAPNAMHLKTVDDDEVEKLVDYVIQSAVMDENTCDPCGDADELTFDYDDADREFYAPPFVNCLGGGLCRCVQIYVLKDGGSWVVREDQIL
ncbi:MAG: hypothetical protein IPO08_21635 [Xanthomonadales bacterium]|nr:hypothetical protein [Xanthomonadales bacterium]